MFAASVDEDQIIARVAALDIGKAELVCCVRVPAPGGLKRRAQEVTTHTTMTRSLAELANRLVDLRVERVVMELGRRPVPQARPVPPTLGDPRNRRAHLQDHLPRR